MFGNNVIMLEGNLTNDPEKKYVNETPLTSFRIGVNERISEDKEKTLFIDVDAWYERSETCDHIELSKGDRVIVIGSLEERSWQDQEGKTRSKMSVTAKTISLAKRKPVKTGTF